MEESMKNGYLKAIGRIWTQFYKGENAVHCTGTGTIVRCYNERLALGVTSAHHFLMNIPDEDIFEWVDKTNLWFTIPGTGTFRIKAYFVRNEF